MLSRIALFSLLAVLSVAGAVAQSTYTFCYQIVGQAHETLDDPYSIAVLVTGTYNNTLQTSTAGKYTPAGQYYTLLTATGTRTIHTRNNKNVTYTISKLLPSGTDFSDNRFYISNASFPQFVDGDGLTFNLTTLALFPGKTYSTFYNLYRSGVYGAVLEDKTSGEDLTRFNLSASITGWTGKQYVAGSCNPLPLEATASPSTKPATSVYTVTVFYNISSEASEPAWNVVVNGVFKTDGVVYGPDAFGDYWFQLNTSVGAASGTRKYSINGTTSTATITNAGAAGVYGFTDNRVYTYTPYLDYNGIAFYYTPAQAKPGYVNTNLTNVVNPYVSKGGEFFEGFGAGGTGPNGYADNALTKYTISIARA